MRQAQGSRDEAQGSRDEAQGSPDDRWCLIHHSRAVAHRLSPHTTHSRLTAWLAACHRFTAHAAHYTAAYLPSIRCSICLSSTKQSRSCCSELDASFGPPSSIQGRRDSLMASINAAPAIFGIHDQSHRTCYSRQWPSDAPMAR